MGRLWFAVALLVSATGQAASLGDLVVTSKAGERLHGRIALVGTEGLQQRGIIVALGSEEDFGNRGLERFGYLETLRFQVEPPHVLVSSRVPIADAYLNFLVRLTWPGGTSLREYDVLLNAPDRAPTKPPRPIAVDERDPAPPVPAERTVTVRPQDTLWRIAADNLPNGINVQQHMLAILHGNPDAFATDNINGLVAGTTLRLPDAAAIRLTPQEAIDEAGRQNNAWAAGGGGRLRILDPVEDGPPSTAVREPAMPEMVAEPPPDTIRIANPPPEPPLADLLREARIQTREQARQLQRRDGEIARLSSELAALQAARQQERKDWQETLGRWRIAALAGLLPTAGLIAVGLAAWRRRQSERPAKSTDAPDYDFGAPIGDGRIKLNMAKAHLDLGDEASARELLDEVIAGGADKERAEARALLEQLAGRPSRPARS